MGCCFSKPKPVCEPIPTPESQFPAPSLSRVSIQQPGSDQVAQQSTSGVSSEPTSSPKQKSSPISSRVSTEHAPIPCPAAVPTRVPVLDDQVPKSDAPAVPVPVPSLPQVPVPGPSLPPVALSVPVPVPTPIPVPVPVPTPITVPVPVPVPVPTPITVPVPVPVPTPTVALEDCIKLFQPINNAHDVDYVIDFVDKLLETLPNKSIEEKTSKRSNSSETSAETLKDTASSVWTSFLESGATFLEFVNKHTQLQKGDDGTTQAVGKILQNVGKVHWLVGGLCVVAFVLDQIGQVSENRSECIELLKQMVKLAGHIRQLKYELPQEEKILSEAILLIIRGSMMCASQLSSGKLFSFFKGFVNSKSLGILQSRINQLYQDLTLRVVIEINHQQPKLSPPWKPIHPDYAVGIRKQKMQVMNLLTTEAEDISALAVVIYGFGGIGKTTLATAVVADLDLSGYYYTAVQIHEDSWRNEFKSIQQQILKDVFPAYNNDGNLIFRNCAEGRDHLTAAFEAQGNKPVFIFIDNVLRKEDLQEIFPKSLRGLPDGSRIMVTARNLRETDILKESGLARREHLVDTLPEKEAIQVVFKDANLDEIIGRQSNIIHKTLQICNGIPLVLEIVGASLRKQNYEVEKCTQIFEALETGKDIKEENLSQRLVTSVYNELESSTQEAFLDICCFFVNWSRQEVEYIVGSEQLMHLKEAALVKTSEKEQLIVHDIIRVKGMSMAKSNRFMDMQSWSEAAHDNQKLNEIKGVWLTVDESASGCELEEKHLDSMKSSLRVLRLGSEIKIKGLTGKKSKFRELRFLHLGGDISGLGPLNLESLERLAVFYGPVFKDGVTLYQLPKKLRVMRATAQLQCGEFKDLEASMSVKIIQNSSLEELDLKELKSLQRLPQRLDHLVALKVLILDEWDKIEELPEQVCAVRSLRKLSICGCTSLTSLPELIEQLSCLEEINLTSCKLLKKLPSSFGNLPSLKKLNLTECINLKELPSSFGKISSLEVLNLESCWKLEALPSSFGGLGHLKKLSLKSEELKELPDSFGELISLTHLDLSCKLLKELPSSFGDLTSLKTLNLADCISLKELPLSFGKLSSLEDLNLEICWKLEALPSSFGQLRQLKKLSLQSDDLKELPTGVGGLSSLQELKCNCVELKELPASVGELISLRNLDLSCCMKLKSLPSGITRLSSLSDFSLLACSKLEELPSNIWELPRLKRLDLRRCRSLREYRSSAVRKGLTIWLPEHLGGKESPRDGI